MKDGRRLRIIAVLLGIGLCLLDTTVQSISNACKKRSLHLVETNDLYRLCIKRQRKSVSVLA